MTQQERRRKGTTRPVIFSLHWNDYGIPRHTGVPSLKKAPLAPFGPSVVLIEGMPFEGIATVRQKSCAVSRETFDCQSREWNKKR